jgi:hypothetical protein
MLPLFPEFGRARRPTSGAKYFLWSLLFALAISALRVKHFEAWDQVQMLWDAKVSPLLLVGHPHFFRFMAAYPGFVLEELYPEIGFSLYISLFFSINLAVWRQLALLYLRRPPTLLASVLFVAVHFMMNGRGVIAWSSWLIAVWLCLRLRQGQAPGLYQWTLSLLACWLSAVSTGVFVVIVVALAYFYIGYMKRSPWRRANVVGVIVLGAPFLYEIFDYFLVAVNKNLDFYGGGLTGAINMLNHGLGAVFFGSELILLAVLLVVGLLASSCLALLLFGVRFSPMTTLRIMPVLGGMFGFTVLTLAIPLALFALPPLLSHRRLAATDVARPPSASGI